MANLDGFDVSAYQPSTITQDVHGDFAVIKATQGTTYFSSAMKDQVAGAKKTGKLYGLYHFAGGDDPKKEAAFFVSKVKSYAGKALLVLDFEGPALARGPLWAIQWLDEVYRLTGVKPVIYLQHSEIDKSAYDAAVNFGYSLWRAGQNNWAGSYKTFEPLDKGRWTGGQVMDQYTSHGRLAGYNGNLDLDIFYGDRDLWMRLAAKPGDKPASAPKSKPQKVTSKHPLVAPKKAPRFPLPKGYYFGPKAGPKQSVSGYYSHRRDLAKWQTQMQARGWRITAAGFYEPVTGGVAMGIQQQAGVKVDGLIGPVTWALAWTEPIK